METTYIKAINDALRIAMREDENVFLLGEDIGALGGAFKATEGLLDEFGSARVLDTPISESLIVGAAVGAAAVGLRPVAEMQFADFVSCGFDQVVNMAATLRYRHGGNAKCPMVVRCPSGSGVRGGLFHSQNPEAWFTRVPGLKVVAPATAFDAKGLLLSAIQDDDPVIYFEHKFLYRRVKEDVPEASYVVPIGKAALRMEGSDISFITYGSALYHCLDAAAELAKEGVTSEVLDLRTLLPLDRGAILATARKTGKVLIVHEDRLTGGIGGEVAAIIAEHAFEYLDAPVMRLGMRDTHNAFAGAMEEYILPSREKVLAAGRKLAGY
ncbi:MAG: alpha-ketoacid dehydrogenase subunit beta [Nitrospirae bacterium]|nr:alpha-ketoacid dehydrogenase subunit beta [Nitrospirota bacterium]MBI5695607.1 alpha-ketoacid dehydrogenase subunit beta [Nitrospirota bacterium]